MVFGPAYLELSAHLLEAAAGWGADLLGLLGTGGDGAELLHLLLVHLTHLCTPAQVRQLQRLLIVKLSKEMSSLYFELDVFCLFKTWSRRRRKEQ